MKFGFVAVTLCCTLIASARTTRPPVQIRSMIVYQDTARRGYTTAGAMGHFNNLKTRNIPAIPVASVTADQLSQVLNRADNRKHHQTKVGNTLIFAEIAVATDKNAVHRMIISGTRETTKMFTGRVQHQAVITDLTAMRNYIITDPSDLEWLGSIRKKLSGMQNQNRE